MKHWLVLGDLAVPEAQISPLISKKYILSFLEDIKEQWSTSLGIVLVALGTEFDNYHFPPDVEVVLVHNTFNFLSLQKNMHSVIFLNPFLNRSRFSRRGGKWNEELHHRFGDGESHDEFLFHFIFIIVLY